MRASHIFAACVMVVFPALVPAADPATPAAAASPYHTQAQQIIDDLSSGNANIVKQACNANIVEPIRKELLSSDAAAQNQGIMDIHAYETVREEGDWVPGDRARWYMNGMGQWWRPLVALKHFDLMDQMFTKGLSAQQRDTNGLDSLFYGHAQALLAEGKSEKALSAAKGYYNVCTFAHTAQATDLVMQALVGSRAKADSTIVHRFKMQQIAGSQPPPGPNDAPAAQPPADLGENVLKSIKIDPAPYEAAVKELSDSPQDLLTLCSEGNLLLLADRPAEARKKFELVVDLATNDKELAMAIENVARSIRAVDGSVGGANAYILSLRKGPKQ